MENQTKKASLRSSGILAHPTSFPSSYGIGDLGAGAIAFIDFLKKSGQPLWQILPLNPTAFGDSPYQSSSTFAMNELLLCPESEPLASYLTNETIDIPHELTTKEASRAVDFGAVIKFKQNIFRKAFANFAPNEAYAAFVSKNAKWLDDFALFTAIKKHFIKMRQFEFNSPGFNAYLKKYLKPLGSEDAVKDYYHGAVWNSWPESLVRRDKEALAEYTLLLDEDIRFVKFIQYAVFAQWRNVKAYAEESGIKIIGDLPIFVAYDSSDCWVNPTLYQMKGHDPSRVAGVPPDYFSETGQLWGNPLYDWQAHKTDNYRWWISRLSHTLSLVDIVRIDHFRGFESYWSIPYGAKDARGGKWVAGPRSDFLNEILKHIDKDSIIAEDLGVITPEVAKLRDDFALPGMKILQFGMEGAPESSYLPHNFDTNHIVLYTGTHDNNTAVGWYNQASDKIRDYFRRYMNVAGDAPHMDMIRLAFQSSANRVIIPIQDLLGLDETDRMNTPGQPDGNWRHRFTSCMITEDIPCALRYMSILFHRNGLSDDE